MGHMPRLFNTLLQPAGCMPRRRSAWAVVLLLASSALCLLVAAMVMPTPYSWFSNAISESAAQAQRGAWVARLGFLLFGVAVLWLAALRKTVWARATTWMLLAFALCMLGTAAFSHKPWLPNVPFDPFEDGLHSLTATSMGFAFSFGVLARLLQRGPDDGWTRAGDVVALIAASALSPLGEVWPPLAGLFQRALFAVAYAWFIGEALAVRDAGQTPQGWRKTGLK